MKNETSAVATVIASLCNITSATGQMITNDDNITGELTLNSAVGDSVVVTLDQFDAIYAGFVRCWPTIKPLKDQVISARRDAKKAALLAERELKEQEKATAKAKLAEERAAKQALLEAEKAKKAAEREAKAKEASEARQRKEDAKKAQDEAKAKAKADKEAAIAAAKAKAAAEAAAKAKSTAPAPTPTPTPAPAAKSNVKPAAKPAAKK